MCTRHSEPLINGLCSEGIDVHNAVSYSASKFDYITMHALKFRVGLRLYPFFMRGLYEMDTKTK